MLEATCHCGAVRIVVAEAPVRVTECNCSICGRLGALWAYYTAAQTVVHGAEATAVYSWGDRNIAFHHCRTCGCATHYTGLGPDALDRVAVNARLLPLDPASPVPVRRFDGRDSWTVVDEHRSWPWPAPPA
jgi:hypothetical protein